MAAYAAIEVADVASNPAGAHAGHAASNAAHAAGAALNSYADHYFSANAAAHAAANAYLVLYANAEYEQFVLAIRRDFELLRSLAKQQKWTDSTPVSQEVFGPLWTEFAGESKQRKAEQEKSEQLQTFDDFAIPAQEIYVDPGNASKATIQAVLEALSDLHRAGGGLGLEFTSDGNFILSAKGVG